MAGPFRGESGKFFPDTEETVVAVLMDDSGGDRFHNLTARLADMGTGKAETALSFKRGKFLHVPYQLVRGYAVRNQAPHSGSIHHGDCSAGT
jgi:hypothetical protein